MDFETLSIVYQVFNTPLTSITVKCLLVAVVCFPVWRFFVYIHATAIQPSAIRYVSNERRPLEVKPIYRSFNFDADYSTTSYKGIKCVVASRHPCYVQAFWGVPMSYLLHLLNEDWQAIIDALTTLIPSEHFSSRCVYSNDLFQLSPGEEKTIEFIPPYDIGREMELQQTTHIRDVYPFVVLMVLMKKRYETPEPFVIAIANVIHLPDNYIKFSPHLMWQYIRASSGEVGHIKKVFRSAPDSTDDTDELCLACCHRPVSRVFLPCCHACLCEVCYDLCERCPVCRGASSQYFLDLQRIQTQDDQ